MLRRMLPCTPATRCITSGLPLADSVTSRPHKGLRTHLNVSHARCAGHSWHRRKACLPTCPSLPSRRRKSCSRGNSKSGRVLHLPTSRRRCTPAPPRRQVGQETKCRLNTWSCAPRKTKACSSASPQTKRWSPAPIGITH